VLRSVDQILQSKWRAKLEEKQSQHTDDILITDLNSSKLKIKEFQFSARVSHLQHQTFVGAVLLQLNKAGTPSTCRTHLCRAMPLVESGARQGSKTAERPQFTSGVNGEETPW